MEKHTGTILYTPRITEKAAAMAERGVYVFNVAQTATKHEVAGAVLKLFKVMPAKVTLAAVPHKRVMTRGTNRMGQTRGGKKAYVYLKKGDTIDLV